MFLTQKAVDASGLTAAITRERRNSHTMGSSLENSRHNRQPLIESTKNTDQSPSRNKPLDFARNNSTIRTPDAVHSTNGRIQDTNERTEDQPETTKHSDAIRSTSQKGNIARSAVAITALYTLSRLGGVEARPVSGEHHLARSPEITYGTTPDYGKGIAYDTGSASKVIPEVSVHHQFLDLEKELKRLDSQHVTITLSDKTFSKEDLSKRDGSFTSDNPSTQPAPENTQWSTLKKAVLGTLATSVGLAGIMGVGIGSHKWYVRNQRMRTVGVENIELESDTHSNHSNLSIDTTINTGSIRTDSGASIATPSLARLSIDTINTGSILTDNGASIAAPPLAHLRNAGNEES